VIHLRRPRTPSPFPAGRSRGVIVAVDGFFAFVWFGWGQAAAPSWLVVPFAVGTALGALLAVTGVVVASRSTGPLPAMSDPAVRRRYAIIVGLEFGLLGAGAAVLAVTGQDKWVPVWICFGVGVHFFPLAWALQNPTLRPLGVLLVAVAALSPSPRRPWWWGSPRRWHRRRSPALVPVCASLPSDSPLS
jgi:hypothetical protein